MISPFSLAFSTPCLPPLNPPTPLMVDPGPHDSEPHCSSQAQALAKTKSSDLITRLLCRWTPLCIVYRPTFERRLKDAWRHQGSYCLPWSSRQPCVMPWKVSSSWTLAFIVQSSWSSRFWCRATLTITDILSESSGALDSRWPSSLKGSTVQRQVSRLLRVLNIFWTHRSLHPPEFTLMDSFATLAIFFASVSGSSDIPTNADDGGSGNNAYCVVAWEFLPVHNAG